MATGNLKVTKDITKKVLAAFSSLSVSNVLVGIPENKNSREDNNNEMNNATIGYIQENGSDLLGIPPRPFLVPAVSNIQEKISNEFAAAAKAAFNNPDSLNKYFERIGIIASNEAKRIINSQEGFEEISAATLRRRIAEGFKGTKALIVTGQLRNSITYVVEGK